MKAGRVTWIESKLLENLVLSRVDMGAAGDGIQEIVKGFGTGVNAQMINQTIWTNCQRVCKGLKPQ